MNNTYSDTGQFLGEEVHGEGKGGREEGSRREAHEQPRHHAQRKEKRCVIDKLKEPGDGKMVVI